MLLRAAAKTIANMMTPRKLGTAAAATMLVGMRLRPMLSNESTADLSALAVLSSNLVFRPGLKEVEITQALVPIHSPLSASTFATALKASCVAKQYNIVVYGNVLLTHDRPV